MEPTAALTSVLVWLVATVAVLAVSELVLYWWLFRFASRLFWPVALLIAGGAAALGYFAAEGGDQVVTAVVAALPFLALAAVAKYLVRGRNKVAVMMLAPAFLVVALLVIYPFFFEFRLAFANLNLYTIGKWLGGESLGWVGFDNFVKVLTTSPLQTATFWELLGRTLIWTGINLVCHVGFGLALAMLLNRKIRGKGIYRTLLILPWAMPQVVAVLAWRGEFHPQFGFVNQLLGLIGVPNINWWSDPVPVFLSCCIVNVWLGIPFMMIVFLGGLQAIPNSYYEAASIDGASKLTQFFQITLPMLKPVVVPSITLGTIWTFNNINVIYLMTGQDGGNEYADILVSALYKSAFTYSRYSFSAAFAMVIFAILIGFTLFWMRVSRGERKPPMRKSWWIHVLLVVGCMISAFPLLRIVTVSLRPGDRLFSTELELIPKDATFSNYVEVFTHTNFFTWLFNSLVITVLTAVIGVCLAATAAYALSRYRFPLRNGVLIFLMATQMIPVVVLLLPLYFMLKKLGLIDTFAGVVAAYSVTTLPFCVWLLKGYFDTVPRSLEEAAQVDGLTEVGSFWKIVLPLSTPSLAIAMLYSITQAWNEYIVARVILQSAELYTWPLGLFELQGDFSARWGLFAAASVAVSVPVVGVFLYSSRWLLSGMTLGGVKG